MARAGNAVIGALKVILSADTAQFEQGLKIASSQLNKFSKSILSVTGAISAAFSASLAVVTYGIKSAINTADEFGKAAQKFGVPVEQLSALAHAASLADVSLEQLGTGLGRLSKSMANNSKATQEVFQSIGVATKDANGNLRSTEEVFKDIADVFFSLEDGAGKTALAIQIFGKAGAELIPLLNAGSAGIKEMTDEARALGLVITRETAAGAEQFNDNLTRISGVLRGAFLSVVAELAPKLAELSDRLVEVAKNGELVRAAVSAVEFIMRTTSKVVVILTSFIRELQIWSQAVARVWEILSQSKLPNRLELISRTFSEATAKVRENVQATRDAIDSINNFGTTNSRKNIFGDSLITDEVVENTKKKIEDVKKEVGKIFTDRLPGEGTGAFTEIFKEITPEMERMRELWDDIGRSIERGVGSVIDDLINKTITWKSILSDVLNIATQVLSSVASNSISNAGGWGQILGFAHGGSFKVGGIGGTDSQLVQFMASPNETVSVTRPGDDAGPGGFVFSPVNNITVAAGVSREEIKVALDARDKAMARQLPGQIKANRQRARI